MTPLTRLLLISTSTVYGTGYLDHAEQEIRNTMGAARRVIFIPYALADHAAYASKAVSRFENMGFECRSIDQYPDGVRALDETDAVFVAAESGRE